MPRRRASRETADAFERVRRVGLMLADVESVTRYDGAQVLKARGCFMAGLATHPSAEPGTLVVRMDVDERRWLLDDAPDTYYLTAFYEEYPLVRARTSRLDESALCDLLATSHRLTLAKARPRRIDKAIDRAPHF